MKNFNPISIKKNNYTIIFIGALFTLSISISVIIGWIFNVEILKSLFPGAASMKFNTALGLAMLSVLLLLATRKPGTGVFVARLLSIIIIILGCAVLFEYIFNFSLGIHNLFISDTRFDKLNNRYPGRMSLVAASCFLFMGLAFLFFTFNNQTIKQTGQWLVHIVSLVCLVAMLGYLFGFNNLYNLYIYSSLAFHTAISFLVLSICASLLHSHLGFTGLFLGSSIGNIMVRKLVPKIVIAIILLAFIRIELHRFYFVDVEFGIAMFALSFLLTFLFFIARVSVQMNEVELKRTSAENSLTRVLGFLESTPDPLLIVNNDGKIIFANKQTEIVFGYTSQELIGGSLEKLIPARYHQQHGLYLSRYFANPKARPMGTGMDLFGITKNNIEIPIEISLNPVTTTSGVVVSASIRDISKRKQTELALKLVNEQYATFVKEAPSAIAMFDTEMKYIAASNKWVDDYQLKDRDITGVSHYDIFPEIGEDWKQIHSDCLQGAVNKCDEAFFERTDGTYQWISWDVRPWYKPDQTIGGIIMLTTDLTVLKQKEQDTKRFENILEKTSSISQIGAWEVSLKTGQVYWSKVVREILEADADYAPDLQSAINMYTTGENRDMVSNALKNASENGEPFDLEVELKTLKGKTIPARVIGQVETINGRLVNLYGVLQNLEKTKQTEKELKELLHLSNDQNKRLKNFAQIVSHNLRSHSGNIHMLLQRLIKKQPELAEKEIMQHIITGSDYLQETIANLSDIVIINTSTGDNMTSIPLKETIDKCITTVAQQAKEEAVSIINETAANLHIKGVKAYTESIMLNFITNGIKYRSTERASYIKFKSNVSDKFLILSIEDNGIGIDLLKNREKLFGMYKTFHGNADARGLGLFMSKNQLEAMGGRIEVDSKPNEGTTFKLYFQQ